MSCPMFIYGLTAGSIIPLSIVYVIRPESLTNLFDFISSSLLIAFNWSEGVAQRFNLSNDLFSNNNNNINTTLSIKMYSCYTIEYWYNIFSWIIYICLLLSLILFILNQHLKTSEEFFSNDDNNNNEQEYIGIDFVFYYFCIFIIAIISILIRILIEYYLLGYLKVFTIVYLLWYIVSFAITIIIIFCFSSMNETNLASIVLGIIVGFYSTIFLLCLSDVIYLNKEMTKMKSELADIKNIHSNQSSYIIYSNNNNNNNISSISYSRRKLSGQLCLSYNEQRQILDYINFICNMAILLFGSYSIYIYGFGTHHGLVYRLVFFIFKILTIIASIWLNLHFKQGLPSDILLYIWIDINCIASIYRSIRQTL